jgi:hypothetical protein
MRPNVLRPSSPKMKEPQSPGCRKSCELMMGSTQRYDHTPLFLISGAHMIYEGCSYQSFFLSQPVLVLDKKLI